MSKLIVGEYYWISEGRQDSQKAMWNGAGFETDHWRNKLVSIFKVYSWSGPISSNNPEDVKNPLFEGTERVCHWIPE